MEEIHEMVVDTPQERICERTGGKVVGVPGACIMKDIHEVMMDIPQEPISERTGEQFDDSLLARVLERNP